MDELEVRDARALWIDEPGPEEVIQRPLLHSLIYVFRPLLESTASEHGALMTAMRSVSEQRLLHDR